MKKDEGIAVRGRVGFTLLRISYPRSSAPVSGRVEQLREEFPVVVANACGARCLGVRWQSEAATPPLGMTLYLHWTPNPKGGVALSLPAALQGRFPVKQFRIIRRLQLRLSRAG